MVKNIYVRLQPSTVHGVGVFAIKDIPQNFTIFPSNCTWKKVKKQVYFISQNLNKNIMMIFLFLKKIIFICLVYTPNTLILVFI